ncbi:hypothetical protein [Nonomuraea sp. NPDC049504]|uniref:hypothetical protein n=1 Tax=Nonomuraea sp. NPDC049504 TaxID=3154729 RepID=UPI00343CBD94
MRHSEKILEKGEAANALSGLAVNPALPESLMLRKLQPEAAADALPYLAGRAELPEPVVT